MALSGQLSDLSLAELIEFFCNQRKTGRLKVAYERTPGYFYFDRGDLVDAKVGSLNGIEAIYYALTLANASFKFSAAFEAPRRTIHQPWTQVTLEGLRRLDEGIKPKEPFADAGDLLAAEAEPGETETAEEINHHEEVSPLPLSLTVGNAARGGRGRMGLAAAAVAIVALVAVAGVPAGWYSKGKAEAVAQQPVQPAPDAQASNTEGGSAAAQGPEQQQASADPAAADPSAAGDYNALAAKRARELKERASAAAAARQAALNQPGAQPAEAAKKPEAAKAAPKMISVQVTYDEAGRVTQTSGGDSTAQRIARQKRFPAGKSGTTTVTIPIN